MAFKAFLEKAGLWEGENGPSVPAVPSASPRPSSIRPSVVPTAPRVPPGTAGDLPSVIENQLQEAAEPGLSKYMTLDAKYVEKVTDPTSRHGMVMMALETIGVDNAQLQVDIRESIDRLNQLRGEADSFRDEEVRERVASSEERAKAARERAKGLRAEADLLDTEASASEQAARTERATIDREYTNAVTLIERRLGDVQRLSKQINGS